MRAISVHQPWAWAILHAGKSVENRCWRTHHRGPVLIHAAKTRASYDRVTPTFADRFGVELPDWADLDTRAILGVVDLVDCVRSVHALPERVEVPGLGECKWAEPDCWCWVLENPRPFAEPIPYRGAQLLFHVPDTLVALAVR